MDINQRIKILREEWHRHYAGEVRPSDFYSAEYYDPQLHLYYLLEDIDYDADLEERYYVRERNR